MTPHLNFLVVDFRAEGSALLCRTLQRKFPAAVIRECEEAEVAAAIIRSEYVSVIISHRTFEHTGAELVKRLRAIDQHIPIVMTSDDDLAAAALAAGASVFLPSDEWHRIGTVVEALILTKTEGTTENQRNQSA